MASPSSSSPLDWSFYATESSVIFTLEPTDEHPYWVEAHGHFGRFGTVPVSVIVTSHSQGVSDGVEFLEHVLTELFWRRFPAFFRQRGPGIGIELQPAIYYFGIRLPCDVLAYDNPKRLDLPHQARQQVERIVRSIPQEDLSPMAQGFESLAGEDLNAEDWDDEGLEEDPEEDLGEDPGEDPGEDRCDESCKDEDCKAEDSPLEPSPWDTVESLELAANRRSHAMARSR